MSIDITTTLKEITTWPVQDQIDLFHQMWDHLVESGWQPELTDAQKTELDRRLDALDANPKDVVTWEEIVQHVRRPR
jgi:putative addiction module component (TIGR02574 family)